jgi:hypothetical protein
VASTHDDARMTGEWEWLKGLLDQRIVGPSP